MSNEELWQAALAEIELQISPANYITWFRNTAISSHKDGEVIVGVPNGFTKRWLEDKYHKFVLKALRNVTPEIKEIKYIIDSKKPFPSSTHLVKPTLASSKTERDTLPLESVTVDKDTNLNQRYTLESFVVGPSNEFAYAAAQAVIKQPGTAYNPFFVYGGVGLGKTHLIQAIGNSLSKKGKLVAYLPSESFIRELITAIDTKKTDSFKDRYRKIDVLIIDDVQFIAGKEKSQEEFFHTFNALYENNKQIVLSSDRPPKSMPTLEERLRSRFEGGMMVDIGYPEFETRVAILQRKCKEKNISIQEDVLSYVASLVHQNIRELEGALNLILASPHINKKDVSLEYVKKTLQSIIKQPAKTVHWKRVVKVVSDFYEINEKDVLSKNRRQEIAHPRQLIMYIMREHLHNSFPFIGNKIGGRDHTTVMHACERIKDKLNKDEPFQEEFGIIQQQLYNS